MAILLAGCGDAKPLSPADPATLARLLSSAFGFVPGQLSAFVSTAPLVDIQPLCGAKGKETGAQRVTFQTVEILEREGVELYTVKATGRCRIEGATGYRTASGRFRVLVDATFVETKRQRRGPSEGYFSWSLKDYALLEAEAPGAWVEEQQQPPPPHCPESVAKAASETAGCNPRNATICWYGEMGCQCSMMGMRWKCGMGGCPSPRPEPGAACSDPLVRCLPKDGADAGRRPLTCEKGRWAIATEAP